MRALLIFATVLPLLAQTEKRVTYDDDVKAVFRQRCFGCHSAGEMRAGLNLETYAGVMKGGGSGDIVKPGRATSSILYLAVAHEGDGVPRMPLGQARIPEAEIAVIRDWIQQGLLENASSQAKGPVAQSVEYKAGNLNRPSGPPAMPSALSPIAVPEPARPQPITAMAASPWAPLLAVSGHERIYLYDIEKRISMGAMPFPEGIPYVLRFSRDSAILLAGGGRGVQSGRVVLYDVQTGKRLAVLGDEADIVLAADISADGKLVALGGPKKVVKVYAVADGKLAYQITKHTDWITAIEFSPDGSRLATADRSGGIHLWEGSSGGIIVSLSEHKDSVTSLSWRGDGHLLASGSEDGQLIIWDARDGFPAATVAAAHTPKPAGTVYGKPQGGVLSVQFMPDGRLVSVGRDRTIRIWNSTGKPQGASTRSESLLTKVASGYDGKLVVAGDYEGHIQFWDGKQMITAGPSAERTSGVSARRAPLQ
jgi:dipeptidyl aminopeptidase/acylaminoacyl peptidase/mono/diheme cytochrome c family protein